jgi:hypothetical protein
MIYSTIKITTLLLLSGILSASCTASYHTTSNEIIKSNQELISYIEECDPKDTFYSKLNRHPFTEKLVFNHLKRLKTNPIASEIIINKSNRIEIIYLYTQTKALDNFISNDEITPLLFLNNKYLGKGWQMRDSVEQNSKK